MYDDHGRLLYTQPETEWDDTEREWMHARREWRDEHLCPRCGLPKVVCRDENNERAFAPYFEKCFLTAAIIRQQGAAYFDESSAKYSQADVWGADLNLPTAGAP